MMMMMQTLILMSDRWHLTKARSTSHHFLKHHQHPWSHSTTIHILKCLGLELPVFIFYIKQNLGITWGIRYFSSPWFLCSSKIALYRVSAPISLVICSLQLYHYVFNRHALHNTKLPNAKSSRSSVHFHNERRSRSAEAQIYPPNYVWPNLTFFSTLPVYGKCRNRPFLLQLPILY